MTKSSGTILDGDSRPEGRGAGTEPRNALVAPLFTPVTIGGLTLRNRVVMSPMTRGFSPQGVPGADVAAYYGRRAEGETGLIITEGVGIDHPASLGDAGLKEANQIGRAHV